MANDSGREVQWDEAAKTELDAAVERAPVLVRISMAKHIRDAAERAARRAGEPSVTSQRLALAIAESGAA